MTVIADMLLLFFLSSLLDDVTENNICYSGTCCLCSLIHLVQCQGFVCLQVSVFGLHPSIQLPFVFPSACPKGFSS